MVSVCGNKFQMGMGMKSIEMGGNWYEKSIPAHLYYAVIQSSAYQVSHLDRDLRASCKVGDTSKKIPALFCWEIGSHFQFASDAIVMNSTSFDKIHRLRS